MRKLAFQKPMKDRYFLFTTSRDKTLNRGAQTTFAYQLFCFILITICLHDALFLYFFFVFFYSRISTQARSSKHFGIIATYFCNIYIKCFTSSHSENLIFFILVALGKIFISTRSGKFKIYSSSLKSNCSCYVGTNGNTFLLHRYITFERYPV